jgi:hypothetical protein
MFIVCENRVLFLERPKADGFEHQPAQLDGKEALESQREKHDYEFSDAKAEKIFEVVDSALDKMKDYQKVTIVLRGSVGNAPLNPLLDDKFMGSMKQNMLEIFKLGFLENVLGKDGYKTFKNACFTDGFTRAFENLNISERRAVAKHVVAFLSARDLKQKLGERLEKHLGVTFEIADPEFNEDKDFAPKVSVKLRGNKDDWWNETERFEQVKDEVSAAKLIAFETRRSDLLINQFLEKYGEGSSAGSSVIPLNESLGSEGDYLDGILKETNVGGVSYKYFIKNKKRLRRKYGRTRFAELSESFFLKIQFALTERQRVLSMLKTSPKFVDPVLGASEESDEDLAKIDEQMKRLGKTLKIFWGHNKV